MATAVAAPGLTAEQQTALATRDVRVALSAGAGCGKTFVLTERFLSHLEPHAGRSPAAQLNRLIAITFTERAAREMRDRVRKKVRERLAGASSEAESAHWLEVFRRLDTAQISTIHSFCGTLLRGHAVEAGLDPRFGVLEPTEAGALSAELIEDELRRRLADRDPTMLDLAAAYDLAGVRAMVDDVLGERFRLRFAEWLDVTPETLAARWKAFHARHILPELLKKLLDQPAWSVLRRTHQETPPPHPVLVDRCRELFDIREKLVRSTDDAGLGANRLDLAAACEAIVEHARIQGTGGKKEWSGLEDAKENYKSSLTDLRDTARHIAADAAFDEIAARTSADAALKLVRLAAPIDAAYAAAKRDLGRLDFDDLLLKARDLLCGPTGDALRRRFAAGVELLLVDECQDVDPLQAQLIEALVDGAGSVKADKGRGDANAGGGKLFFVGDFKQSIYRFRRADPRVFHALREATPRKGRLPLTLNFRSRPAILEFVNALFEANFGDEYEALRAHKAEHAPAPAVEFLWATPVKSGDSAPTKAAPQKTADDQTSPADSGGVEADEQGSEPQGVDSLRRLEAEWIARRIRQLLDDGEPLIPVEKSGAKPGEKPLLRPAKAGDIAMLFRALSNVGLYEAALERYGIPYYVVGGKAFYAQQEIYDLLNFLRSLESTCDDVALAGVLRSPFFSLRDETLLLLVRRDEGKRGDAKPRDADSPYGADQETGLSAGLFSAGLSKTLDKLGLDDAERRRVEFAARTIRELREVKNRLPIADLLNEMLARTAYDAVLTAEFLGKRKLANLRKLVDMARGFDRSGVFTLGDFIARLADFVVMQPDEPLAATHAEGTNVVRLMSIHQSKGLEFPIVFVPDLNRKPMMAPPSFAFHDELGPVIRAPAGDDAVGGMRLYSLSEHVQAEAESLRVFYVAATRAADYLFLCSGLAGDGKFNDWLAFLAGRFDVDSGKLTATLPKGYAVPRVRVTSTAPPRPAAGAERPARPDWPKLIADALRAAATGDASTLDLAPIAPHAPSRRRFSFSRISENLEPAFENDELPANPTPRPEALPDSGGGAASLPTSRGKRPGTEPTDRNSPEADHRTPDFGTLVHGVLAVVDFDRPQDVEPLVRRLAGTGIPCDEADRAEAAELVRRFLASPRGEVLQRARQVHRELEFLLAWPPNHDAAEGVYLQGFIDLLYEDNTGKLHLVDFKTHVVAGRDPAAAARPYEMQLVLYALACERILGRPPDELVLHFLRGGVEYAVAWNEKVRDRAIAELDRTIAELRR